MLDILSENEAVPASYPATPSGLSNAAGNVSADVVWQRIEASVAHRWTAREVIWIVEGVGQFLPRLTPAEITATERWDAGSSSWETVTPDASPLGGVVLKEAGPHRITTTVGADATAPAAVNDAFRRLAEYMAGFDEHQHGVNPGWASQANGIDAVNVSFRRSPEWLARAIQWSGAADLLRPYRRA